MSFLPGIKHNSVSYLQRHCLLGITTTRYETKRNILITSPSRTTEDPLGKWGFTPLHATAQFLSPNLSVWFGLICSPCLVWPHQHEARTSGRILAAAYQSNSMAHGWVCLLQSQTTSRNRLCSLISDLKQSKNSVYFQNLLLEIIL